MDAYKLYFSKLSPDSNDLWQRVKTGELHYTDPVWYEPRRVGKDMLERFMKINLQKSVVLAGQYTNHSIRSTVIRLLDNEGYEARHIVALSSHKNESTIKDYATTCPDNKRKEMFDTLQNAMLPKSFKFRKIAPAPPPTISKAQEQNTTPNDKLDVADVKENLPTFDLQSLDDCPIDDKFLSNLMDELEKQEKNQQPQPNETQNIQHNKQNNENKEQNKTQSALEIQPLMPQPNITNNQINTFNQMQTMPRVPPMFFPHSNVTINYNYHIHK